ncbi:KAP family P-loop NTPase fold protein [Candidatus Venteria ishoeyi]|uniref:KAP family P-loop domain protein n=2 Tax=Candidatus Venteria ishoeyi TaxID=1899563 RepID=A0A1H6FBW1_9GAMM|nr:P-loop NTPase fold protein [Candidatus Venteria ishoeyi]SEH07572.1 KAP family P-loop domain protein [Candidatus Venteria ishoeyi]
MPTNKLSHNDAPVVEDAFQQKAFIQRICKVVKECRPPKGIAINGYWGTGKTSALMQVYYQLSGKHPYNGELPNNDEKNTGPSELSKNIVPVWFEAWRYQHEALPIVALLNEIREQLDLWEKFKGETEKLSGVAWLGTLSVFDEVIKAASGGLFSPKMGNLQKAGNNWEAQHYSQPLPTQKIHNLFEEAVCKSLGGKSKRLVIFVDDLDRCTPAAALRLLEGIKVYLNLESCVVIFGMDQRQIERALKKALDLNDTAEYSDDNQAREYLEKICQDIYHLPLPDQAAKSSYFMGLLSPLYVGENKKHYQRCLQQVLDRYDCLPANPRKIKALVNRTSTVLSALDLGDGRDNLIKMGTTSEEEENLLISRKYVLLMALTIIYCFHRQLNEQLEKDPSYIDKVIIYAKDLDPKKLVETYSIYRPFQTILPAMNGDAKLPANPSDSNVFRLHDVFRDFDASIGNCDQEIAAFYAIKS